jgi:hypothetical protein
MTSNLWPLVELAARPLDRDERNAVLGDSLEAGDGIWQAFSSVLGLVLRRQLLLWKSWRPWLTTFVFGLPGAYLLMIVSISVTCTYDRLMGMKVGHWAPTGHEGFALLFCHIFLLIGWSWTSGFILGSLSPKTLWLNAALCFLMIPICDDHLRTMTLSMFAQYLFLIPAIWGVCQGIRTVRLKRSSAFVLAATITVLMIAAWTNSALWILNWLLLCPAWSLVATARQGARDESRRVQRPLETSL